MKIFVNYRRDDARAEAARLRDRLAGAFGEAAVFMDVSTLVAGQRFDKELDRELAQCNVLIAVIGPRWLELLHERDKLAERDYVREEIAFALKRAIPVIPVMIDRATLPRAAALPDDMQDLVLHQKYEITHEHFARDVDALVKALRQVTGARSSGFAGQGGTMPAAVKFAAGAGAVALAGLIAAFALGALPLRAPDTPTAVAASAAAEAEAQRVAALERAATARAEAEARKPTPLQDCAEVCPRMMAVPAGTFAMGSVDGEPDELPVREVTIGKKFAIGIHEVTFAQWDACVADSGCRFKPPAEWGRGHQPVISVSWDDITQQYLPWLSRKTGKTYRLPTEAEWEFAARAGTATAYAFGPTIAKDQAQYADRRTAEIGRFTPNAWGLHDMHGNVREWVADCHADSYGSAAADGTAFETGRSCVRVARGGSWEDAAASDQAVDRNQPNALRSANRDWESADSRTMTTGFRVARDL